MEIYLIRHTTPHIEKGICYGQYDVPLADTFLQETTQLKKHLPEKFDAIYSSTLSRCIKLADYLGTGKISDARLMEMNFGDWEMQKWDDIEQSVLNNWMVDFVNVKTPNGENFIDLHNRSTGFWSELMKKQYTKVAVVTHAGIIRSFIAHVLEIPLKNAFKIPVTYSSVTKLNVSGDGCYTSIEYLNKI